MIIARLISLHLNVSWGLLHLLARKVQIEWILLFADEFTEMQNRSLQFEIIQKRLVKLLKEKVNVSDH